MSNEDRFKQAVVVVLAKRAAHRCSNPECNAVTSGPAEDPRESVNVGVAAHIYGANPGSARYEVHMTPAERSAISNAIWLCSNCHKMVDDDDARYPPGLLFEWQREHERAIAGQVGKAAAMARQRYEVRHLEEFGRLSYLAERLILERGDYWEYLLSAEVLRYELGPVVRRWRALKSGLYTKPFKRIPKEQSFSWVADRIHEVGTIVTAFGQLNHDELQRAWGAPGVAGDDVEIVTTCRLFVEMCSRALDWEESVQFARVDDIFVELRDLLCGVAGTLIEQVELIPTFLTQTLSGSPTSGEFVLQLTVKLPDGWLDSMNRAMKDAQLRYE
jgi:hypothetical protein